MCVCVRVYASVYAWLKGITNEIDQQYNKATSNISNRENSVVRFAVYKIM